MHRSGQKNLGRLLGKQGIKKKGNIKPLGMILPFVLSRQVAHLIQHIFNEDPVARGGGVHKDMSHSAHQLAVLNDRTAGHALDDATGGGKEGRVCDL